MAAGAADPFASPPPQLLRSLLAAAEGASPRAAAAEDVGAIAELEAAAFPADERASRDAIAYRQGCAGEFFMVVTDASSAIVGFINGTSTPSLTEESMSSHHAGAPVLAVHSVVVAPSLRRRGLALAMLRCYLRAVASSSPATRRVALLCKPNLIGLYRRAGFECVGPSPVVHGSDQWFEMSLDLDACDDERSPVFVQVDAFAVDGKAFTGNPAAVVLTQRGGDATWMQAVANENNLAETSFLSPVEGGGPSDWNLRWFTPNKEVELCGHATVAAAAVLFGRGLAPRDSPIRFHTLYSGILGASPTPGGGIALDFPATPPAVTSLPAGDSAALLAGLSLGADGAGGGAVLFTGRTLYDVFVEVTPEAFDALRPQPALLEPIVCRGVIVTASGGDGVDFRSRFFAPRYAVPEDHVTGSAHAALGPYWDAKLSRSGAAMAAVQASPRGGRLEVAVRGDRVSIAGRAVVVIEGRLRA